MPASGDLVDIRRCRLLGLVGSAVLAAGGSSAGALPVRDALPASSGRAALGLAAAYFGLVLLVAAWLRLGRAVRGPEPPPPRDLLRILALWVAPLLFTPPLFSRDVYSYLAQGAMVDEQIDVYTHGPAELGGPLAAEVPGIWQHTPTPYGPVFLGLAAGIADLARVGMTAGVLGMRLVALSGVALMVVSLRLLARRPQTPQSAALWLGALNPLVLLHLVAGAHNDAVMLGLLGLGLAAAQHRWPLVGAVLVTLAALVKAPAALGLLAVAALRAERLDGRAPWARAAAAVGGAALVTTAAATAVTGTGYGWIASLRTPVSPGNWAPTSLLGRLTSAVLDSGGSHLAPLAVPAWHLFGLATTAVVVLVVWLRRPRLTPVHALGLSLAAVAALGPAIRPWYVLWGVFLVAATAPRGPVGRAVAAACAVLALVVLPSGFAPDRAQLAFAVAGGACAVPLALLWQTRRLGLPPRRGTPPERPA
ncbi:polyprenol phosphomannose-dependent alpha 1,6 mannosyltransferase MptB [Streptomyces sp. WMMC500]|uniref:polyprenol phosphomannose-dependent alpha 1,6 mannosyltransferase MptB n=1 Tax=Streptomyces sp. WMMC500 TaxID=3015154 RepID=UPI00248AB612|nr:polyprenol phosphomannose-dependent alpha 1,6 mannosyltransferase MptB [Streptomyces sp. WMMC500]WBB61874.1 polyprenol phosphomannose-dependent alpha 1,6 mannosyltransferase MptB [Streptomyces sp. WMMC500]